MNLFSDIEITDPNEYMRYVGKLVKIYSIKENIYTGHVYTIDPVSRSVVLIKDVLNNSDKIIIIPGTSVKSIDVIKFVFRYINYCRL